MSSTPFRPTAGPPWVAAIDRVTSMRFATPALVVFWLCLWHVRSAERFSLEAVGFASAFVATCMAYGTVFERWTAQLLPNTVGSTYRLLTGFFCFNSLLFVLTLSSRLGIFANVSILVAAPLVILATTAIARPRLAVAKAVDERPGFVCLLIAGAAATLWTRDLQPVMEARGGDVVFRAWFDIFIHVREISAFAQSHGLASMSDIKMLGTAAPAYHFASYVSTAAFSAWTSTSALVNFGGFQLPFGILLTACAAFVLVGSVWSVWPGVAAAFAVVALPDAYEQGFGAGYLGFHFMSQANLGMLYGLACVAIAWVFVLEGCRRAALGAVVMGYAFLALTLFYKAHLFVANAYLLLIFPWLYFASLARIWRLVGLVASTAVFVVAIWLSQQSPMVPTLRIDGTGAGAYMRILYLGFDDSPLKSILDWALFRHQFGRAIDLVVATLLILFGTFGYWVLAGPVAFWKLKDRVPKLVAPFVLLVVANYFVMSLGLAMDERRIGTPEELINRPMAWAYFASISFATAAVYRLTVGLAAPHSRRSLIGVTLVCVATFVAVVFLSHDAQTFRPLPNFRQYATFNSIPACQVRAAEFIRLHARADAVIQDSDNDPSFVTTALAERQAYVVESFFAGKSPKQQERLRMLESISIGADVEALRSLAAREGIDWYLIHPQEALRWPAAFLDSAAFTCDAFRVIRLNS